MQRVRERLLLVGMVICVMVLVISPLYAQDTASDSGTIRVAEREAHEQPVSQYPVNVYGHVFGGMGFSYLSAGDVKDIIGDDFGVGIGLPTWSYGIRGGFRNIFQVEYNTGKADHDFNNNSIIKSIPSEVIKMDYDTHEVQFKLNPTFWKKQDPASNYTKAFFLVYGFGDVEWRDKNDDGFSGKSTIYGIEYASISKYLSLSISFKRYGIAFDETTIFGISFEDETDASDYILEMKIGFGYGI